jgi:hypothetical protein
MSNKSRQIKPAPEGMFDATMNRVRLILRLMADPRVSLLAKMLPVGALFYLLSPDILPGPVDDAFLFWLGNTMFVELCPPDVVKEHLDQIRGITASGWDGREGEVIDAQARDLD